MGAFPENSLSTASSDREGPLIQDRRDAHRDPNSSSSRLSSHALSTVTVLPAPDCLQHRLDFLTSCRCSVLIQFGFACQDC